MSTKMLEIDGEKLQLEIHILLEINSILWLEIYLKEIISSTLWQAWTGYKTTFTISRWPTYPILQEC